VTRAAHRALKGHKPCVVWFTGIPAAGKSTIASLLQTELHSFGVHTCLLEGDNVRQGLNRDLGFDDSDRVENVRRVAEVASLMAQAGLVALVALISPFKEQRALARGLVGEDEFIEVFVDTPLAVAERRDPNGLYRKARRGEVREFTGFDSAYEPPENPELRIDTTRSDPQEAAGSIIAELGRRGVLTLPQLEPVVARLS